MQGVTIEKLQLYQSCEMNNNNNDDGCVTNWRSSSLIQRNQCTLVVLALGVAGTANRCSSDWPVDRRGRPGMCLVCEPTAI